MTQPQSVGGGLHRGTPGPYFSFVRGRLTLLPPPVRLSSTIPGALGRRHAGAIDRRILWVEITRDIRRLPDMSAFEYFCKDGRPPMEFKNATPYVRAHVDRFTFVKRRVGSPPDRCWKVLTPRAAKAPRSIAWLVARPRVASLCVR